MSYSLESKCSLCEHLKCCIDASVLMGAIYGIHSVNMFDSKTNSTINRGHVGFGVIELRCGNFKPTSIEDEKNKENNTASGG